MICQVYQGIILSGDPLLVEAREPALRAKHTGQKTTRYAGG